MSEFAISKSLRTTPKVNAGLANNAFSERFLNAGCLGVCPTRYPMDDMQRGADLRSLHTLEAGCNSAMERINIETAVERPYYTYLPLNPDGINQNYTTGGGYDMLGVRRDEVFNQQNYPLGGCGGGPLDPAVERVRYKKALSRYYNKLRYQNRNNF
jgi:hypothetical protein